jgi:penicillin-binding protein 2
MDLGNNRFHCWKRTGHGHVNMVESLKYSCDVYYYEVAKRTGIDRIAAMARRFGLGAPTGIELPNEYSGLIPSVAWKSATYAKPWHTGETLNAGIGQGYVLATPLQLAVMVARIANGGYEVFPNLSHHHRMPDGTIMPREKVKPKDLNINPVHLQIVKQGMFEVVNTPRGTARRSALRLDDIQMAGKTGTAQVRRITRKERQTGVLKNNELPWRDRDHALFVAFAPYDKPQYAVAVVVEHGGGGSSVAAPIARDILEKTFEVAQHIPEKIQAGFLPADGALDRQLPPAEGQV